MTAPDPKRTFAKLVFRMRFLVYLLVSITAAGCAQNVESVNVDYEFLDEPTERRISLSFQNPSDSPICMSLESWPNDKGEVGMPGEYFTLVIADRKFPVECTHFDFCPRCVYFVLPGEKVTAYVPYESFGIPSDLVSDEKALQYQPTAFVCRVSSACVPDDELGIGTWSGSKVEACGD
jgi:hypothetical protein